MRSLTKGEKIFNVFNILFLGFIALICVYPFMYTLTMSFSSATAAARDGLHIFPTEFVLTSYEMVFNNPDIITGYFNSVVRTVLGTVLSVLACSLAAYPLARKEMSHRSMFTFLVVFTMLFGGSMVPNYLLIRNLGMIDTVWALILPMLIPAFNVIIIKNFFQSIPESLSESAKIDGAGDWCILFRIYMPLSKAVLATVALWTSVAHWNAWFDALLYITDDKKQVLQTFLQRIVIQSSTEMMELGVTDTNVIEFTSETIKAATIIVTILPILCVYPFVQKYFVKGIMLGGVKE